MVEAELPMRLDMSLDLYFIASQATRYLKKYNINELEGFQRPSSFIFHSMIFLTWFEFTNHESDNSFDKNLLHC